MSKHKLLQFFPRMTNRHTKALRPVRHNNNIKLVETRGGKVKATVLMMAIILLLGSVTFFSMPVTEKNVEDDDPIADAGPDQTVHENQPVSLDGSASKGSRGVLVFDTNRVVGETQNGRNETRYQLHPNVEVDDIGIVHVVWCAQKWNGDRHIFYTRSTDQGMTFEEPLTLSDRVGPSPGPCNPDFHIDKDSQVHVIWTNVLNPDHPVMYYSASVDQGTTFSTPIPIDYGNGSYAMSIISDSKDVLHIAFSEPSGNLFHIKSTDDGATFSDPTSINDVQRSASANGQMRLGPDDSLHVVWVDDRDMNTENLDVYYSVSRDGGQSFKQSVPVHEMNGNNQEEPALAVDKRGVPHVTWEEYRSGLVFKVGYAASQDGGETFDEETVVEIAHQIRHTSIDVGDDGLPQIVWDDWGESYDYQTINYTKMNETTKQFDTILKVNDDDCRSHKAQPNIDVDLNGTAHVVWVDLRGGESRNDVYYARSIIGRARIVSYMWDTDSFQDSDGDGNSTNDADTSGPTPTFTYGDDGVFLVTLKVTDELGKTAADTTEVTVLNVDPAIVGTSYELEESNTSFMFRIAGEKWHNVMVVILENGAEIAFANVTRQPGSPNDQIVALGSFYADPSKMYSAVAYYTPEDDPVNGQPWGATPAWLIINSSDYEERLHHTFNVIHNETWIWSIDNLNQYFPLVVAFEAVAYDPGSDDLEFIWDFGDVTASTMYYNNGIGPDLYPSPDVKPITARDTQLHDFAIGGTYEITLTIVDDDGGIAQGFYYLTL